MEDWNIVWNMLSSVSKFVAAIAAVISLIKKGQNGQTKRRSNIPNRQRRLPKK